MAKPVDTFSAIVGRADTMVGVYKFLRSKTDLSEEQDERKKLEEKLQDLLRSALVISVSAFDSYFTDKFVDKAPQYLKKHGPSDNLVVLLTKAGVDLKAALKLLHVDRPMRRIRTYIQHYLEDYVTQEFSRIDELFLSFGIKDLTNNAARKTGTRTIGRSIQTGIKRRHGIVHAGDLNHFGKPVPITARFVEKKIKYMRLFIKACDEIINSATK